MADAGEAEQGHSPPHRAHQARRVGQVEALRLEAPHAHPHPVLPPPELHGERQPVHFRHHQAGLAKNFLEGSRRVFC